jgi:hypothetical protein
MAAFPLEFTLYLWGTVIFLTASTVRSCSFLFASCLGKHSRRWIIHIPIEKFSISWVWWCKLIIPALRRLEHEDHKFKDSLGCIRTACLKTKIQGSKRKIHY